MLCWFIVLVCEFHDVFDLSGSLDILYRRADVFEVSFLFTTEALDRLDRLPSAEAALHRRLRSELKKIVDTQTQVFSFSVRCHPWGFLIISLSFFHAHRSFQDFKAFVDKAYASKLQRASASARREGSSSTTHRSRSAAGDSDDDNDLDRLPGSSSSGPGSRSSGGVSGSGVGGAEGSRTSSSSSSSSEGGLLAALISLPPVAALGTHSMSGEVSIIFITGNFIV